MISFEDCAFGNHIDAQVQFGLPCLLENVDENLDPGLGPILLKQVAAQHRYDDHCEQLFVTFMSLQTFRHGGADCIQIGENVIEYNNDFKFYIATESR